MHFIKSALRLFRKNLGLNVIIILQLCAAVFLINSMFIFFLNQNVEYNISKRMLQRRGGFLFQEFEAYQEDFFNINNDNVVSARELSKKYNDKANHYEVSSLNVLALNKITLMQGVDEGLIDLIDLPLKKGVMFNQKEKRNGVINAVGNFGKVGQEIEVLYDLHGEMVPVRVALTGLFPASFPIPHMKNSINFLSDIFTWKKSAIERVLLCDLADIEENTIPSNLHCVSLFVFNDNASDAEISEMESDIRMSGSYFDLEEVSKIAKEEAKEKIFMYLPLIVFLTLLSVLNFSMSIALCSVKSLKDIAIMFLCGAKRKDADKIIFIFSAILCVFAVIGITLLTNFIVPSFIAQGGINNPLIIFSIITISLGLFTAITLLCSRFSLNQKNIAKTLRNEVKE